MKKMYQVFVSSTFEDLQNERLKVLNALLSFSCIPAGMELFSAGSDEQFEYIKRVIDKVDYYVLIVAGRYGSNAKDGKSYTEKEFDYAKTKGIPILVFLNKHPENIPSKYVEQTDEGKEKLEKFRKKVCKDRMVAFWENEDELATKIISGLREEISNHPRDGWIKGSENVLYGEQMKSLKIELEQFCNNLKKQNSLSTKINSKTLYNMYKGRIVKLNKEINRLRNPWNRYDNIIGLTEESIDEIVSACFSLFSNHRTGSLIVIEQVTPLDENIKTGVKLDAIITCQLLESIFERYTSMHEGAVIIRDNRIASASCYLFLSDNPAYLNLGTRHRAAIGMTEQSDCIVIVTSEETGTVSIAYGGKLYKGLQKERFVKLLNDFLFISKNKK